MENKIFKKNSTKLDVEIDWKLVKGFEKSLEDLKKGRIIEY